MIRQLKRSQQPWTVTTAAEVAAIAALDDEAYLGRTIDLIATESARLTDRLWDLPGLRPVWPARERPRGPPPRCPTSSWSAWSTPPGIRSSSRRPWPAAASSPASARTIEASEIGSAVTGPGAIGTNGHLRFCVRTPAQNDLLLATLARTHGPGAARCLIPPLRPPARRRAPWSPAARRSDRLLSNSLSNKNI